MKKNHDIREVIEVVVCFTLVFLLFLWGCALAVRITRGTDTTKVEAQATQSAFDTSALDSWCKGDSKGQVRMIGAWEHSRHDDVVVVEDEQGNLWDTYCQGVGEDDFLLLWLNDNGTPDNVRDDYLVKVWKETHG